MPDETMKTGQAKIVPISNVDGIEAQGVWIFFGVFFTGLPGAISRPVMISDKYSCVGFISCRAFTIPNKYPDILVSFRLY